MGPGEEVISELDATYEHHREVLEKCVVNAFRQPSVNKISVDKLVFTCIRRPLLAAATNDLIYSISRDGFRKTEPIDVFIPCECGIAFCLEGNNRGYRALRAS